jgi:ABC-type transport system substrate-binding protein
MSEHIVGLAQFSARVSEIVDDDSSRVVDLRAIPLQGVQAVDRYTIRVTLYGHYPQFVYWLAMPFFAPMPWEAEAFYGQAGMSERNITLDWYPLGSGPYMLTEHNPNRRMVLQRNPHFHGERYPREGMPADVAAGLLADSGEALPFIQRAVYSLERESIPAWNKFVQGYYDVSSIGSDSFDQAVSFGVSGDAVVSPTLRARGIELTTAVSTSSYYMGFNMLDPVLGGGGERARTLRQAISIAVDFEEYISIFANGRGVAAQGPLPPGIFGHRPGRDGVNPVVYRWHRGRVVRRPVEEARQLLAEAGYAGGRDSETGEPLALYFDTTARGPDDKARLDWMRKQFAKLDIQLVVRATDYNRFQETMRNGKAQIFMWGWNADYPDPENFLFLLYGPNGKVRHGGENAANYSNPEFDALFDTMKNLSNGRRRQELIDRMVRLMRSDAPWAWGYHPMDFSLHHGWYANVKPNLMANNTLKYRRIDPQERGLQRQAWNEPVLWPLLILAVLLVLFMVPAVAGYLRRERARVQ